MEFFTDTTAFIDEGDYGDAVWLQKILRGYHSEKKGSVFEVRGSYEQLETLSVQLSNHLHPDVQRSMSQQATPAPTPDISVKVSGFVMDYIQQKCADDLTKIGGHDYDIETQAEDKNSSSIVRVTITPRYGSTNPVRADYIRQKFISFYQRTVADLQVTSVSVSPHKQREVQRKFPQLVFKANCKNEVTVTGPYEHIIKLEEFLSGCPPSSRKSPVSDGLSESASSRALDPKSTPSTSSENESCPICMEIIVATEKKTLKCKHVFCNGCLDRAFQYKPVCPTCGDVYGVLIGTQPEEGTMDVFMRSYSLPGYESYGTIEIQYEIPGGIQKEEHPNPGQPYDGTSRTAYLPDSPKGRQILGLLTRAFNQRLTFTVGRSITSGMSNVVTWNDIHHKTSTVGGSTGYGYPDPDYLSRLQDDLKAKGIE